MAATIGSTNPILTQRGESMCGSSENVYYRVGQHTYCVQFTGDGNTPDLLASSAPFRQTDELVPDAQEPLLFRLVVDDSWKPQQKGAEIGKFPCGDEVNEVYRLADGTYQFLTIDALRRRCSLLQATPDFSSATVCLNGDAEMRSFGLNTALMMMYAFAGATKQTVLMHASVVRKDGRGYLCLGESGTGKSTHTANWLRYIEGTDLMNDDNPVVRVCEDGVVRVFGSPWSGKTPCYRDVEAPIGGFLQLKQAPHNRIRRMETFEAYASLLSSCSVMKWDRTNYVAVNDTIGVLLEQVPVYFLENLPDEAACRLSYETMSQGLKS
ncbi:MAG: hypothetical protein IJV33_07880 [Bacteroidaceae bacterium]|nr:hypothetical protein [Bacteroidaceae bacterium]